MNPVSLLFHDVYLSDPGESGFVSPAADRYKLALPDFEAQLNGLKDVGRPFTITVDDGGVSFYTLLAERVEALGRRAHCFVSTAMIGSPGFLSAAQIRELDARGHLIGSHSVTHPARFSACSLDQMRDEWSRSRRTLEDILGHEVVAASVPGGYYSRRVAETAAESGLTRLFNSEPTTAVRNANGLLVVGRYTIRQGDPPDAAGRLVAESPWARSAAWASWNAKGIVKPLLGPSYRRVADWVLAHE
jgi:peptidoglycan/xylan/chitin deacetylase (PgdA/CDA1 family)